METNMRMMRGAALVAAAATLMCGAARADYTPPFKGNDTGGIISYSLVGHADIRDLALDHCARYGKGVRVTGVQPYQGGYLSFHCVWVPPPRVTHVVVRARY
jgi:hypothetical protein